MLADFLEIRRVVIACGYVDRKRNAVPVLRTPRGPLQGLAMARQRFSPSVPQIRRRFHELAQNSRRSSGDHGRTVSDAHDGAQSAPSKDPGCIADRHLLKLLCKTENFLTPVFTINKAFPAVTGCLQRAAMQLSRVCSDRPCTLKTLYFLR